MQMKIADARAQQESHRRGNLYAFAKIAAKTAHVSAF